MSTHAAAGHRSANNAKSHHPNYMAVFVWLILLTALEVSIPEFVHIKTVGADPTIPTVSSVTQSDGEAADADEVTRIKASMAPNERFHAMGWGMKIGILAFLAIVKAVLVAMFFMHLKFDGWKINVILAVPTILFLVIILLLFPDIGIQWPAHLY